MDVMQMTSWILAKVQAPNLIFWWPYLLSAFILTLVYLVKVETLSLGQAWKTFWDRRVWLSRTTLADAVISLVYALFLAAPAAAIYAGSYTVVAQFLHLQWLEAYRSPLTFALPGPLEATLVALVAMLFNDMATYAAHRALHAVPTLWGIHAVHHSAEQLTFLTTHRQHPLELVILNVTRGVFTAVGLACLYFFLPQKTPGYLILGVGAGFFFYLFIVNIQHSHVPVRFPRWLGFLILSPHVHHLHHSRAERHLGTNYGVIFPFWDRIFGTYTDEAAGLGELSFGLEPKDDPFRHSLVKLYLQPLIAPFRRNSGDRG